MTTAAEAAVGRRGARLPGGGQAVRRRASPTRPSGGWSGSAWATPTPCAAPPTELLAAATPEDGEVGVLVAPMVAGNRELIAGLAPRSAVRPMTVMVGVGGILAEAVADVVVPARPDRPRVDAEEMIDDLATQALLGPFRGEPAVDRDGAGRRARRAVAPRPRPTPTIVSRRPEPADRRRRPARSPSTPWSRSGTAPMTDRHRRRRFQALFDPKGVVVAGASTHPGKFGFVSLHNILAAGYEGDVFATNREGAEVLGVASVARRSTTSPTAQADLVVRVHAGGGQPRPAAGVRAPRASRAAFLTSAGYGEAGEEGRRGRGRAGRPGRRARHPARRPERPGRGVDAGVAVRPDRGARTRRPGRIGVASQSGNFVSSFMNYAVRDRHRHQPGRVGRQRRRDVSVADYLDYYADDPETSVGLAYVEGVADGRAFFERLRVGRRAQAARPREGRRRPRAAQRAAASHTGSLATDDRVFDGVVPPGRRHPRRDRRGGVRGRGHLRHPAPARRATASSS